MDDLKKIIAASLRISPSTLSDNSTMNDIVEWDSLSHMTLITEIEEKYEILFTGEDIATMQSIAEIHKRIKKYQEEKNK